MALTGGASHAASGTGTVAISSPAGLRVSFTTIPAFLGSDAGTPREYYNLGRINVGNSFGYLPHVEILCSPQIVLELPAGLTVVAWDFAPGVVASIQELVESSTNLMFEPWDRGPVVWQRGGGNTANGGSGLVSVFTYTVLAGERLFLAHASVQLQRKTVATAPNAVEAVLRINGNVILRAIGVDNVVGADHSDRLAGGPHVLPAGAIIVGEFTNADTGGSWDCAITAGGFRFTA